MALPAGSTAPNSGSNATAQRVKCALTSPARSANRRSQPRTVYPQPRSDPSIPLPSNGRLDRCPDHRDLVLAAQQHHVRQQHVDTRAATAPRPPRHQQLLPRRAPQNPRPRVPPRSQHPLTRRTSEKPADQLALDPRLLGAYDQHQVPPPASRRALPTQPPQLTGGLSRIYERAKPAKPASAIPATNGTTRLSHAGFKRRSTAGCRSGPSTPIGLTGSRVHRLVTTQHDPRAAGPDDDTPRFV